MIFSKLPYIGITLGDPAGIGPEVAVKALLESKEIYEVSSPILIGDAEVVSSILSNTGNRLNIIQDIGEAKAQFGTIDIISANFLRTKDYKIGEVQAICGKAAYTYIEKGVNLIKGRKLKALVTAPISKAALKLANYDYPGHTELLAALSLSSIVRMMFVLDKLRVVLVTTHIPLRKVPTQITTKKIAESIKLTDFYLKNYFGYHSPKIGVCGLNPHAGEEGILGKEEEKKISPAINRLRKRINVEGPYPADMIFTKYNEFEAIIALYHDQGLIPVKLLNWQEAVNLTLGLPFIRTSPAHGTAYDIAGKNIASPKGMISAILLAAKLAKHSS
jgi:4-hydroxythreonine-4-phosphate dehydrogenase